MNRSDCISGFEMISYGDLLFQLTFSADGSAKVALENYKIK